MVTSPWPFEIKLSDLTTRQPEPCLSLWLDHLLSQLWGARDENKPCQNQRWIGCHRWWWKFLRCLLIRCTSGCLLVQYRKPSRNISNVKTDFATKKSKNSIVWNHEDCFRLTNHRAHNIWKLMLHEFWLRATESCFSISRRMLHTLDHFIQSYDSICLENLFLGTRN